jgi:hypothetical protein
MDGIEEQKRWEETGYLPMYLVEDDGCMQVYYGEVYLEVEVGYWLTAELRINEKNKGQGSSSHRMTSASRSRPVNRN